MFTSVRTACSVGMVRGILGVVAFVVRDLLWLLIIVVLWRR